VPRGRTSEDWAPRCRERTSRRHVASVPAACRGRRNASSRGQGLGPLSVARQQRTPRWNAVAGQTLRQARGWKDCPALVETGSGSGQRPGRRPAPPCRMAPSGTRRRRPAYVKVEHLYPGWSNCGATAVAMFARHAGSDKTPYDVKRLCPRSPIGTGTDWADLVAAGQRIGQHWQMATFPNDENGFDQGVAVIRHHLDAAIVAAECTSSSCVASGLSATRCVFRLHVAYSSVGLATSPRNWARPPSFSYTP